MILAGCILKDPSGNVLLMHRNTPQRTQWEIPGGKVEAGEAPEQAAVRELAEELGVTVEIVRHIGTKSFEEDGEQHAYHWFEAVIQAGEPELTPAIHNVYDGLSYFSLAEMQALYDELSPNTRNFVQAVQTEVVEP